MSSPRWPMTGSGAPKTTTALLVSCTMTCVRSTWDGRLADHRQPSGTRSSPMSQVVPLPNVTGMDDENMVLPRGLEPLFPP